MRTSDSYLSQLEGHIVTAFDLPTAFADALIYIYSEYAGLRLEISPMQPIISDLRDKEVIQNAFAASLQLQLEVSWIKAIPVQIPKHGIRALQSLDKGWREPFSSGVTTFTSSQLIPRDFACDSELWDNSRHRSLAADIRKTGAGDLVGLGAIGNFAAMSKGTDFGPMVRISEFSIEWGDIHLTTLVDVTGDGYPDLVTIGDHSVTVAQNNHDGTFWGGKVFEWNSLDVQPGLSINRHLRLTADITGNKMADIVAFGDKGVWVAFNGGNGTFATPELVLDDFGTYRNAGFWHIHKHPRFLADLTGDGRADIIGFGNRGVLVSLNTGDRGFHSPKLVVPEFGYKAGEWRVAKHPRFVVDLTGDGRADIIGFKDDGVYVALNEGNGTFKPVQKVLNWFGYSDPAGRWRVEKHPRFVVDVTGNKCADIVGFWDDGVWIAFNNGDGTFQNPQRMVSDFGYEAGEWRVERHTRVLADMTGNGRLDIVGFGEDGMYLLQHLWRYFCSTEPDCR